DTREPGNSADGDGISVICKHLPPQFIQVAIYFYKRPGLHRDTVKLKQYILACGRHYQHQHPLFAEMWRIGPVFAKQLFKVLFLLDDKVVHSVFQYSIAPAEKIASQPFHLYLGWLCINNN